MATKYIKLYVGPCETTHNIKDYIPHKVYGLRNRLRRHGYRVDIIQVDFVNYCKLEMCGYEIFRCNLKNLGYNMAYQRDEVCRRAVHAAIEATERFAQARNYLWMWEQVDHTTFRSEFGARDYWAFDIDLDPIEACIGCDDCGKVVKQRLTPYEEADATRKGAQMIQRSDLLLPYVEGSKGDIGVIPIGVPKSE